MDISDKNYLKIKLIQKSVEHGVKFLEQEESLKVSKKEIEEIKRNYSYYLIEVIRDLIS